MKAYLKYTEPAPRKSRCLFWKNKSNAHPFPHKTYPQAKRVYKLSCNLSVLKSLHLGRSRRAAYAALFHREDGADLVWSRPKTKTE